jgi:hypothetical protein
VFSLEYDHPSVVPDVLDPPNTPKNAPDVTDVVLIVVEVFAVEMASTDPTSLLPP